MRSDWKYETIADVCEVVTDGSHYSPKSVQNGKYMVSVKDFTEYGFDFLGCRQISDKDYKDLERGKAKESVCLFSRRRKLRSPCREKSSLKHC